MENSNQNKNRFQIEENSDNDSVSEYDDIFYQESVKEVAHLTYMINSNMCLNRDVSQLHYEKGMHLSSVGNYSDAVECFNKAIEIDHHHADSYYRKGEILRTFLNDSKAAVIALDEAIRINPNHVEAYSTHGYALMDLGRYEDAVKSFDRIITINLATKYKPPTISFEEAIRKNISWNLLELTHSTGYGAKAIALKKLGKWKDVLECYDQLIKHQPSSEHHHHSRGQALLELERYNEALECFDKALNIQPTNIIFLYSKGIALAKLGDRIKVEEFYNNILKLKSESSKASTYLQKGIAMDIIGDKEAAIKNIDIAIKASPNYYQAYYRKGVVIHTLEYKKALKYFNKAIKIHPEYYEAYHYMEIIFSKLEQYWEAIKCCNKKIIIKPNDAVAYNNKGWYLSKLGDHNSALECINHSLEINPNLAHAYHSKGFALSALGLHKEAIESFNKALEIDSKLKEAHSDKGRTYMLLKNYSLAIECFDRALAINNNNNEAFNGKILAIQLQSQNQDFL